jgi:hypothetical protein
VVALQLARAAAALRATRCWPRGALTLVPPCAQVLTVGVPSAGVCPNAVRAHRRRCTPRCSCVPAVVSVASRALLSAALRAASC